MAAPPSRCSMRPMAGQGNTMVVIPALGWHRARLQMTFWQWFQKYGDKRYLKVIAALAWERLFLCAVCIHI